MFHINTNQIKFYSGKLPKLLVTLEFIFNLAEFKARNYLQAYTYIHNYRIMNTQ